MKNNIAFPAALAAAFLLFHPASSPAQTHTLDAPPVDFVDLSSTATNLLLLRPDPDWAAAWDVSNLWTRATLLAYVPASDASTPPTALSLVPLRDPYDPATVTLSTVPRAYSPAVAASPAPAILDAAPAWRYAFDLAPILSSEKARTYFFANGAALSSASGGSLAIPASALLFRAAVPSSNSIAFAVGFIDSLPRGNGGYLPPDTVLWEQGTSHVGKTVLNGQDGSECRAILAFPDLSSIPPEAISSLVAVFDLEIQDTNGTERLHLFPLRPGPALERRRWEDYTAPYTEPPSPLHGPSWDYADGPVGTNAWPVTPWSVPMVSFTNGVLGDGPWLSEYRVTATVVPGKGTGGTARFDLTPLWHDPVAREALVSNGAIVLLDPASWDYAKATGDYANSTTHMTRLNLFRPDRETQAQRQTHSRMAVTVAPPPSIAAIRPDPASATLTLSFDNLDPALDFSLTATPSLLDTNWPTVAPVDFSSFVLPCSPTSPPALFYRLSTH